MPASRKRFVAMLSIAPLFLCVLPAVQAQEPTGVGNEDHFVPLPDGSYRFKNDSGTRINQDYYLDPNTPPPNSSLLHKVERHHMGQKEWDNLAQGRYDSALNDVRYTLKRFPNHPTGLLMMGIIARMTDRHPMAIKYFDHATTLYPQYAFTHALYGKFLIDIEALDQGIKKLEYALELDSKLGQVHGWLAEAYIENGQVELAQEAAQRAREAGYRGRISGLKNR